MQLFQKIWAWIKLHTIISAIILVAVLFGAYQWYHKAHAVTGKVQYLTQAAAKKTITVSVTGTGQVSAQNKIDLKPGGSGQTAAALTSVTVKQGDQVKAGQVIATVDEKNNNVALIQARASLTSAQANYDKLVAGLTGTDLQSAQLSLTEAQQAVDKAKSDYDTTVHNQQVAVAKAQTSMLNSGLAAIPNNTLSSVSLDLSGTYTGTTQGSYTINVQQTPSGLYYTVIGLDSESGLISRGLPEPLGDGLYVTFGTTGTIDAGTTWTISVPNTESSSYNSAQQSYNSALDSQTQALAQAQQSITSAENSLQSSQLSFTSKTAPPSNSDVAQAQAQIAQAQASLASAEVNYDNNVIKSPFDGQVAAINNQVGDQVTSSTVIATVITNQKLAIMSLNEVDAAKVQVGQKANLTFDALDGLNVAGTVAEVDSIGTVSQGVVTYGIKIGFDTQNDQIKAGMSVSADIITNVATDVLTVPSTAVKSDATGSYVQELDAAGQPQAKTVEVGISNDTDTEITSGLNEGEQVITQTINPTAKTSTKTSTGTTGIGIPGLGGGTGGGNVRFNAGGGFGGGAAAGR